MDTLQTYKLIKEQAKPFMNNRHLYVASIVKELFNPLEHRNICEIGAGKLELATILSKSCKEIDAFEIQSPRNSISGISNLHIYGGFDRYVDISKYHLLVSVCPYYSAYDIFDDFDYEKESQNLVTDILDISIGNNIDSFVIVSDTYESDDFIEKIKSQNRYRKLIQDEIILRYEKYGEMRTSSNKVLIYKK
ncbi:MAG: hypothetical protein ACM3O4_02755 [Ignavibacteriales bacterium]